MLLETLENRRLLSAAPLRGNAPDSDNATHATVTVAPIATPDDDDDTPPPGTQPPTSPGNGNVAGASLPNGGSLFYAKDALLGGFEWFALYESYFPSLLPSSHSISPGHQVVDMAYASDGTMTFNNVAVPTDGTYTLTFRYAFAPGLFPTLKDRPMGIAVNGVAATTLTSPMHFPVTGDFENYKNSSISVLLHAGQNSVQFFDIGDAGISRVDTMTVTPDSAVPAIIGQPANAAVTPGIPATFSVAASGPGALAYQWQRNNGAAGAFANIAGATSSAYTLSKAQAVDNNAQFRVVVSNGNGSATSSAATLLVAAIAAAKITGQPANATAGVGNSATFSVAASGSGTIRYQWQRSNGAGGAFANIAGATSSAYTLSKAQASDNGAQFRVVVSNGNGSVTSSAAVLSVPAISTSISIHAGGGAAGAYVADTYYSGGSTNQVTNAIDTSLVAHPAPQEVYQNWRYGDCTYTIPNLTPNRSYTVRLDFCENFATAAGQRVFDVAINGVTVLSHFDIFAAAGGRFRALERDFTAIADSRGRITLHFEGKSARINGITLSPVG